MSDHSISEKGGHVHPFLILIPEHVDCCVHRTKRFVNEITVNPESFLEMFVSKISRSSCLVSLHMHFWCEFQFLYLSSFPFPYVYSCRNVYSIYIFIGNVYFHRLAKECPWAENFTTLPKRGVSAL